MNISDKMLSALYGASDLERQKKRYLDLIDSYTDNFGAQPGFRIVSAPGRTELSGNHTDHNNGKVLCAAVASDSVAVAAPRSDNHVELKSSAFPELFSIDLSRLDPGDEEKGSSDALIRGVAAGLRRESFETGGFNAVVHSDVGVGSGLSSSASFEVLIAGIFNCLYNGSGIDPVTMARIGQYAENVYFGKPCGLMDQLASAVGGVLSIDFENNENPVVEKIQVDFDKTEYVLAVVDTGGSHEDLTSAYASIPGEMQQAAALFGRRTLREVGEEAFYHGMSMIRSKAGDRALLRSLHFFEENRRVTDMVQALKGKNFDGYLRLVSESGASSAGMLQNTIPPVSAGKDQPAALAIGVSNVFFRSKERGVCRIHGGGFAGTIQVYIHREDLQEYVQFMESLFGHSCVQPLVIRMQGVSEVGGGD